MKAWCGRNVNTVGLVQCHGNGMFMCPSILLQITYTLAECVVRVSWVSLFTLVPLGCMYELTLCGAEVGLVDRSRIIVHCADTHTPLVALDL